MQRRSIKDIIKQIQVKEIALPLGYMCILSMLYNLVYFTATSMGNTVTFYIVQIILGLASSVGFYWLCLKCWKIEDGMNSQSILRVLFLETIYLGVVLGGLYNLDAILGSDNIFLQVAGALIAILIIPFQLLYFYALALKIYNGKEILTYIKNTIKRHSKSILNWFCIALIMIIFVDTLIGGVFSISAGIDTCLISTYVLTMANPMFDWMMTVYWVAIFGLSYTQFLPTILILMIMGLWYGVIDLNYVLFIQRKCLDDGIIKTTTNKKKNRTTK